MPMSVSVRSRYKTIGQKWATGFLTLALLMLGTAARAENPEHMRQLLRTGDCKGCDLSNVTLEGLNLSGANLRGADLSGAIIRYTQLTQANLEKANLSDVRLVAVDFMGARLKKANLTRVKSYDYCTLETQKISSFSSGYEDVDECMGEVLPFIFISDFCTDDYGSAEELFSNALLSKYAEGEPCSEDSFVNIEQELSEVFVSVRDVLRATNFSGANLTDATLTNADLTGADLSYADLTGADGAGADFRWAVMVGAETRDLKNVDFSGLWLTKQAIGEWVVGASMRREENGRKSVGRIYVGSMNRAQQAYYLESGAFSSEVEALGLLLPEAGSLEYFTLGIVSESVSADVSVQYALSKRDDVSSVLGTAFVNTERGTDFTRATLCESVNPGVMTVDDLPVIDSLEAAETCPAGWALVQ